jgi:hypothetical protein
MSAADLLGVGEPPEDDRPWADEAAPADLAEPAPAPLPEQPPRYRILSGPEIDGDLPPLEYLVERMGLVAGAGAPHLLVGYGYSGKTVAAQSMLLSLAGGRKVWGAYPCDRRRVLHVDMEQGERLTRRRYQRLARAMGVDLTELGDDLSLVVMPRMALHEPDVGLWRELMAGLDLILIDSLRAATGGQDENSSDYRTCLDMLGRLSEETGCRSMPLHHARKVSDGDPGGKFSIRGSSAIFDACDSVYLFTAAKGEPVGVEQVKARTHGEPVEDWALVVSDVAEDSAIDPSRLTDAQRKWGLQVASRGFELIDERRSAKAAEVKQKMSGKDSTTLRALLTSRPGLGTQEIRALTGWGGGRLGAAIATLGSSLDVRMERTNGARAAVRHFIKPGEGGKSGRSWEEGG